MKFVTIFILQIFVCSGLQAGTGGPALNQAIQPKPTDRWWLFLEPPSETGSELESLRREAARGLSPRSLERRAKVMNIDPPVRMCDIPPSPERLEIIQQSGLEIVTIARYLNAVSVRGDASALETAAQLEFVKRIRPVMALPTLNQDVAVAEDPSEPVELPDRDDPEDYGESFRQAQIVNLPAAHDEGYRGNGVLIGVQDTGFNNLAHNCFRSLDVLATWDFLNGDENVGDENDRGRGSHGTRTLSVIAGLDSGFFIGAAPGAQFVLTKTENTESETPVEEDYWVAGLWFHDSIGVDILSSSLSYRDWYDYSDMDGETAVTTRAADSAAAANIVIVNSIGNTGRDLYPYTKAGAPADGHYVLSVGGVVSDSSYWTASSQGPTYDGRIKPDVVALGYHVKVASAFDSMSYPNSNGTSFACPMIAGIAALMLEAEPRLTATEIRDILRETADQSEDPDTLRGFGIVDALAAVRRAEAATVSNGADWRPSGDANGFHIMGYPNPTNGFVSFSLPSDNDFNKLELFDLNGVRVIELAPSEFPSGSILDVDLDHLPSGEYIVRLSNSGRLNISATGRLTLVK